MPLDVKASGVDFCCAGTYKWLMGEFGMAFLYVRSDRLPQLKRVIRVSPSAYSDMDDIERLVKVLRA